MSSIGSTPAPVDPNLANTISSSPLAGGTALDSQVLDRIVNDFMDSFAKDGVTLAKLSSITGTLDNMVRNRKLTQEQASTIKQQIRERLDKRISSSGTQVGQNAQKWLKFGDGQSKSTQKLQDMAHEAATNRRFRFGFFGHRHANISKGEVRNLLKEAASDGSISLEEINAMYQGINDAFNAGEINEAQRAQMTRELDSELQGQAGKRKGPCAHRMRGQFHDKLTPEAKAFMKSLGSEPYRKGPFSRWHHHQPHKVQNYVKSITQDGFVSQQERSALINLVVRDGKVTNGELVSVRLALHNAMTQGVISADEYDKTLSVFETQIASMTTQTTNMGFFNSQRLLAGQVNIKG